MFYFNYLNDFLLPIYKMTYNVKYFNFFLFTIVIKCMNRKQKSIIYLSIFKDNNKNTIFIHIKNKNSHFVK